MRVPVHVSMATALMWVITTRALASQVIQVSGVKQVRSILLKTTDFNQNFNLTIAIFGISLVFASPKRLTSS